MNKRDQSSDVWCTSTLLMLDCKLMSDPNLIPAAPYDGRDLPDVELEALVELILANLTREFPS